MDTLPAKEVLTVLNLYIPQLFMQFGIPQLITSDNGSEFNNHLNKAVAKKLGIKHIFTTPYHPQVSNKNENQHLNLTLMFHSSGKWA